MSAKVNILISMIPASAIYEMKQSGVSQFEATWDQFRTQLVGFQPVDMTVEDHCERIERLRHTQTQLIHILNTLTTLAAC